MMMIIIIFRRNFVERMKHALCAIDFCQSHFVRDKEIEMSEITRLLHCQYISKPVTGLHMLQKI